MFIQTQSTPNPDTMKFLPGEPVSSNGNFEFASVDQAVNSPLARSLFLLRGVSGVFFGEDFVSVSKSSDADWPSLKPQVLAAIMDHYLSGLPVLDDDATAGAVDDTIYEGETAEIVAEIKELIATRVRPAVANDGGDIVFHRFEVDTGIVYLEMRGACSGCPSSTQTLKQGVENLLRHYVPEVTAVQPVM